MNLESANLTKMGWDAFFADQCPDISEATGEMRPARVFRQDMNQYHLYGESGELIGQLRGKFRQTAESRADYPAVGDWVLVRQIQEDAAARVTIDRLLARKTNFSRIRAGDQPDEQVIAANIDTLFIVSGLDGDFNPNRIERYLLLGWDSGATPVILLNKMDICDDLQAKIKQLEPISKGTPVLALSAINGFEGGGLEQLGQFLGAGKTAALVGSSGVGKSTIINALLGYERLDTGEVRETDSRGRHTTTFRELVPLPGGGMIMDTPGMREIQLWADEDSLSKRFADIEALAIACKFSDCRHVTEPGCAIREAIRAGRLEEARLQSYLKLHGEITQLAERQSSAGKRRRP